MKTAVDDVQFPVLYQSVSPVHESSPLVQFAEYIRPIWPITNIIPFFCSFFAATGDPFLVENLCDSFARKELRFDVSGGGCCCCAAGAGDG